MTGGGALLTLGACSAAVYFSEARDDYNQFMAGLMGGMARRRSSPACCSWRARRRASSASHPPAAPRWSLGVAPLPGGATAGATVSF